MGDIVNETMASLKYGDLRRLAEHAARCFPETEFFLCSDKKMPSVSGAELFRCAICRPAMAGIPARDSEDKKLLTKRYSCDINILRQ